VGAIVARLPLRRVPRFFGGYARSEVFFRLHLKVEPHLLFQLAVESIPPRVEEQLAPEL